MSVFRDMGARELEDLGNVDLEGELMNHTTPAPYGGNSYYGTEPPVQYAGPAYNPPLNNAPPPQELQCAPPAMAIPHGPTNAGAPSYAALEVPAAPPLQAPPHADQTRPADQVEAPVPDALQYKLVPVGRPETGNAMARATAETLERQIEVESSPLGYFANYFF